MSPYRENPELTARRIGDRRRNDDAPGIVIQDGGAGHETVRVGPRVRAFVYGEAAPVLPTLPFGRWKVAS